MLARNVGLVNAVLMTHARAPLRLGEIADAAGLPRQVVASALRTLERRGIAQRRPAGKHDVFAPNTAGLYYPAAYLAGLVDLPIAAALAPFRPQAVLVYGSMAIPGHATPHSDLDLLVVTDETDVDAIRGAASAVGRAIGRAVDAYVLSPEAFEQGVRDGDPHIVSAADGVLVAGARF